MTVSSAAGSLSVDMGAGADRRPAVEAVFDRCGSSLYRYFAVRTGGDTHLADDLMQQLWLQAGTGNASIADERVEAWLRSIAKNLIRTHWRKRARRPDSAPLARADLAAELGRRIDSEELPPNVLERKEVRDQLLLAITELPHGEQELIVGRYFHELSQAELAARLGITERGVEGRLYRARAALREKLTTPARPGETT